MVRNEKFNFLKSIRLILNNQRREEKLKGEKFNIFSILNMETKENGTHSAFLGELLNPYGSHLRGNLYLNLFLDQIGDKTLDRNTTRVILEKNIGPVIFRKNPMESSGGRIDIYLEDDKGKVISIENKLNAPEQKLQVVRYYNYKKNDNTVFYLTLDEKPPTEFSMYTLVSGEDFYEINYGHDILKWLNACQKESTDNPIIRETIKQYSILLKKLTGQMSDVNQKAMNDIILSNYEAAQTVSNNILDARKVLCHEIHTAVFKELKNVLASNNEFLVEMGNEVWKKHAQIWIRPATYPEKTKDRLLNYVLESFSGDGHFNGDLFLGILNPSPHRSKYALPPNDLSVYKWIINRKMIPELDGIKINLNNPQTIQRIYLDETFKANFVSHIVNETINYLNEEHPNLKRFLETGELPKQTDLLEEV